MKFNNVIILTSLVVGLYISGCYTIVQHPDITEKDENGYSYNNEVAFYDDCGSCHSDDDPRKYSAMSSSDVENAHTRPYNTYEDGYYYEPGSYYDYGNYGSNIGYYYNYPWWFEVVPPRASSDETDKSNSDNSGSRIRNNDGGRTESSGRSSSSRERNYDRPTVSAPSSGSSGSSNTSATKDNSGSDRSSGTRSRSEDSSNGRNENSSSSEQPRTRNNDGGRSGGSGRR